MQHKSKNNVNETLHQTYPSSIDVSLECVTMRRVPTLEESSGPDRGIFQRLPDSHNTSLELPENGGRPHGGFLKWGTPKPSKIRTFQ